MAEPPSTAPEDPGPALLASEQGAEQGRPCPGSVHRQDQQGCRLLLRLTLGILWCVLDWSWPGQPQVLMLTVQWGR